MSGSTSTGMSEAISRTLFKFAESFALESPERRRRSGGSFFPAESVFSSLSILTNLQSKEPPSLMAFCKKRASLRRSSSNKSFSGLAFIALSLTLTGLPVHFYVSAARQPRCFSVQVVFPEFSQQSLVADLQPAGSSFAIETRFLEYFLDSWFFGAAFYLPGDFFQIRQGSFPRRSACGGIPGHYPYLSRFLQFLKGAFLVSLDQETLREALQFANISGPWIFQTSGDEPLGRGNY